MEKELFKDIEKYDTIVLFRHDKPDLDALGSQVGLYYVIKENYPNKKVYMVGDGSIKYGFIGQMDIVEDSVIEECLAIILEPNNDQALVRRFLMENGF